MKKIVKIGFWMVLLAFAVTACATGGINTPLPQTLNIEHSAPGTPKEIADYIGIWEGVWDLEIHGIRSFHAMAVTVVIEKIKDSRVTAIYSWGNWKTYIDEGWIRITGIVENGKVILHSGSRNITLDKNPGNVKTLNATYSSGNWRGDAVLFRGDSKNLNIVVKRDISHLPEKIRAYNGTWKGMFNNGSQITDDIEVISEKKVIVNHSWGDNPDRNVKAGSWRLEAEFNKDGFISIDRGNRILTIKFDKDGTLNVRLEGQNDNGYWWLVDGDLKKIE